MLSAPYALGSMAIWTELKQREQLDLRKRVDEVADVLFRRSCFRECHPGCASQDVTTKTFFECFNGSHCKMKHHNIGDSASRSDNPLPDAASRLSSSHVLPPTVSGVLNGVPDVPETVVRPLGAIILKTNQHLGGCVQLGEQAGTATGSAAAASVTSVTGENGFTSGNCSQRDGKHHNSGDSASRSDNPLPDAASRLSSSHVLPPTVSGVLNGVPDVPETVVRPLGAIILKTNQHLGGCVQLGEQAGTATGSAEAASVTSVTGGMGGSASGGSKRGSGRRGQRGAGKRLLSSTGPMADTQCPRLAGDSSAAASGLDSSSDPTGHLAPRGGRGRA
jgi:hypothetical protein